ncbi:hypothetical protein [Bacillus phage BC-T25]|nr:hypothetical protein [Bacillus phage BC-T25]
MLHLPKKVKFIRTPKFKPLYEQGLKKNKQYEVLWDCIEAQQIYESGGAVTVIDDDGHGHEIERGDYEVVKWDTKKFYAFYTYCYNSFPVAPAILTYVDKRWVPNIEDARKMANTFVRKLEGHSCETVYLGEVNPISHVNLIRTDDNKLFYLSRWGK